LPATSHSQLPGGRPTPGAVTTGPGGWALASESASTVLKQIAALFGTGTATGLTDGCLLDRFRSGPSDEAEAAFAVLVERHGPMVLHVCRRILADRHDAEDAAQAVFLVLARQARSIRRTDSVASWLYGVAARVAARARLDAARRRSRERRSAEMAIRYVDHGDGDGKETWPELYEELGRLPERFWLPIALCHLEGLTYEQAAQRLGCPVRTVQSRLARARERLRDRLARRGVAPAIAALTIALTPDATSAAVSGSWKRTTVMAAVRHAAGGTVVASVPTAVAVLAEGASRAMNVHRLMKWAAALLLIGVATGGAGMGMRARTASPESEPPPPAVADDNRYRVTMAGGVTFEVVAVSTHYASPKTWWRPDGTPLDESPADPSRDAYSGVKGEVLVDILVRVENLPEDSTLKWVPTYDGSCPTYLGGADQWGSGVKKDGRRDPELRAYVASFHPDRTNCSVHIQFAAGPWKTVASDEGRSFHGGGTMIKDGYRFYFGTVRPYQGGTIVAVAHNVTEADLHTRLMAVDWQGKEHPPRYYADAAARTAHSFVNHFGREHPANYASKAGREILGLLDAEFALPPEQIREYRVQSRRFERAEIEDIALKPRPAGKPTSKVQAPSPRS
jgi:RNA polymerase sigma factor (sigma-70 family)